MDTAGIAEIRKKLDGLSPKALKDLCLRLARYKKENKELLSYLLYYAGDEEGFITEAREEMAAAFSEMNTGSVFWVKKSVRKIHRSVAKYIKYSGNKQTEAELLIAFCRHLKKTRGFRQSPVLQSLYDRQVQKIQKAVSSLHEDLQYDYTETLAELGT